MLAYRIVRVADLPLPPPPFPVGIGKDVVDLLLAAGADPSARNRFGWSAWEYHCEAEAAGVTAPYAEAALAAAWAPAAEAFAAAGERTRAALVAAGAAAGGETRATFGGVAHVRFLRDGGATLALAAAERRDLRAAIGYGVGAGRSTWAAMREDSDEVVLGGEAVPGVTSRRLGLFAGVRYRVKALQWRPAGAPYESSEPRVEATLLDASPPDAGASPSGAWELVATLSHPACTPWGSVEVGCEAVQLHSISSELGGSIRIGLASAALPLALTAYALPWRVAAVEGTSMVPTLAPGDVALVDTREAAVREALQSADAPVVWVDAPRALAAIAADAGRPPPPRGARLFKRLVATEGDRVRVIDGALSVNGEAERPPPCLADASIAAGCARAPRNDVGPGFVPPGAAFVLGDNRGASTDSAAFGAVDARAVRGVVREVLWPLPHAGQVARQAAGGVMPKTS